VNPLCYYKEVGGATKETKTMLKFSQETNALVNHANHLAKVYEQQQVNQPQLQQRHNLPPVFPVGVKGTAREEDYIRRMIEADKKVNRG